MRKILVTAISGNVANGILKEIQNEEDELYGCDVNDFPVGADIVKKYWKSDYAITPKYIGELLKKCEQYGITHIIPANEEEIIEINRNRIQFDEKGIKLLINSEFIINTFMNKYETYKYLLGIGISVPKTFLFPDFKEDGKKYIVKFNHSCGSKLIKVITKKSEIEEMDIDPYKIVIQEYMENADEEYTVGVFSNGEKTVSIAFKRKLKNGYTDFVELIHDRDIERIAECVSYSIKLKGSINLQMRKDKGLYKIFEINPRLSGTVYFRYLLGFEDAKWWLNLIDDDIDFEYEEQYKKAIGVRELNEKFLVKE